MADCDPAAAGGPTLAVVHDLIFASRIRTEAAAAGVSVRMIRDPARLADESGLRLIVDLNLPDAIEAAASWRGAVAGRTVVGFVSHVDAETMQPGAPRGWIA